MASTSSATSRSCARSGRSRASASSNPDKVRAKRQLKTALDALAAMTHEAARRPDPEQSLSTRVRTQAQRLRER